MSEENPEKVPNTVDQTVNPKVENPENPTQDEEEQEPKTKGEDQDPKEDKEGNKGTGSTEDPSRGPSALNQDYSSENLEEPTQDEEEQETKQKMEDQDPYEDKEGNEDTGSTKKPSRGPSALNEAFYYSAEDLKEPTEDEKSREFEKQEKPPSTISRPSKHLSGPEPSEPEHHLTFDNQVEPYLKELDDTVRLIDVKRPSPVSHRSTRLSVEPPTPTRLSSLRTKIYLIPAVELLDVFNRLPKEILDKIQNQIKGNVDFLINLLNLINDGKAATAEVSSLDKVQLTGQELHDLFNIIPDEPRTILATEDSTIGEAFREIMNRLSIQPPTQKHHSYDMQLRSRLPSLLKTKIYSISAVEMLDMFNRLPKETLDKIQNKSKGDTEFLIDLYDKAAKAEIASQDNIQITGQEMHDIVELIPDEHRNALVAEDSTVGEVLREIMEPVKRRSTRTSTKAEIDETTKKALDMKEKIEEKSKKINGMKGHLQYYLSKSRKDPEDRKKIQKLQCEIECANGCLKTMIKEFIKLQKDAKTNILEPIMLATTLDEDQMPKCIAIGPTRSDQNRFMTPSVLKNIEQRPSIRAQTKMASDNMSLARERCHLQQELLNRDRIVENLQGNLQVLQCELTKMTHENMQLSKKIDCVGRSKTAPADVECRLMAYKENADALEGNITKMALALNQLQLELTGVQHDRDSLEKSRPATALSCPSRRSRSNAQKESLEEENHDLKKQYALLLQEYSRKEREVKELNQKFRKGIEAEQCRSPERIELEIVRKQYNELLDEQDEFKVIIKEQSTQVEEYRDKFMKAQQIVEEQRRQIENMEVNNGEIEQQINMEIQRIKSEFQKKLREFTPLPKMLENEQLKVHESQKKNRALEGKLAEYGQRLNEAEARANEFQSKYKETNITIIEELRTQVEDLTANIQDLKMERDRLDDNLNDERCRYETLRGETAKIIQRANDRHETARKLQHDQLSKLENDLAKAKADAACDAAMHETTIRKIENQMKILTCNFDNAQSQIRTLQNHIAFLTHADKGEGGPNKGMQKSPRNSSKY